MIIFYLITAGVFTALGFVFWLIMKEQDHTDQASKNKEDNVTAAKLLDRLGLDEQKDQLSKKKKGKGGAKSILSSIVPSKKKENAVPLDINASPETDHPKGDDEPASGTAAMRLDNDSEDIDSAVEMSIKVDELQKQLEELSSKNQKLEELITEKNDVLDKSEKELENERKHRKDFNKVKDVLEKELKESKDTAKELQTDLSSVKSESQTYTTRIAQLEEKIKTLEKACGEKDTAIQELSQQPVDTPAEETGTDEQKPVTESDDNAPATPEEFPEKQPEASAAAKPEVVETVNENDIDEANPNEQKSSQNQEPPQKDDAQIEEQPSEETDKSPAEEPIADEVPTQPVPNEKSMKEDSEPENTAHEQEISQKKLQAEESSPQTESANTLGLDPVSNLEENYQQDAAPLPLTDMPLPPTEQAEDASTDDIKEKQSGSNTTTNESVDAFLQEHLKPEQTPKIIPTADEQTLQDTPETKPEEPIIPETDDTEKEQTQPTQTQKPEPEIQPEPLENDPAEQEISESENLEEIREKLTKDDALPKKDKKPNGPHLNPDIFKDIEDQFRQIEEEMNTTQEQENVDTDISEKDQAASEENPPDNPEEEKK